MAIFNSKLLNYQRVYGKSLVFLPKPQVLSSKPMSLHTAGERHPHRRELRNLFQPGCSPWSSRAPRPVCEASPGRVFWGQTNGNWLGKLQHPMVWRIMVMKLRSWVWPAISGQIQPDGGSWYVMVQLESLSLSVLKKCQQAPTRSPKGLFLSQSEVVFFWMEGGWDEWISMALWKTLFLLKCVMC